MATCTTINRIFNEADICNITTSSMDAKRGVGDVHSSTGKFSIVSTYSGTHNSWGGDFLYASSSSEGAERPQQADLGRRKFARREWVKRRERERGREARQGWSRPGSWVFPSAPSSSEAKLILCLRPPWGGSANVCTPAAAGNCLQCRGPWNGRGSTEKSKYIHCECTRRFYKLCSTGSLYISYLLHKPLKAHNETLKTVLLWLKL